MFNQKKELALPAFTLLSLLPVPARYDRKFALPGRIYDEDAEDQVF
jgi:hypothetical protein